MPIYEYRCDSCGFQKEYIQRMNDARLTDCPECQKATFNKMVTAAGFQLKGAGWYVTDFKGGGNAQNPAKKADDKQKDAGASGESAKTETSKTEASITSTPSTSTPSAPASTAASTPAPSSST